KFLFFLAELAFSTRRFSLSKVESHTYYPGSHSLEI
ncbi:unnamed protein product, partial [Arabidopsis halleri]